MSSEYIRSVKSAPPVVFTAGDFVESLSFLDPIWRQAVLFGMEQSLSCNEVVELTHEGARALELTPLSRSILDVQPRHIRLARVFWHMVGGNMTIPLVGLADAVDLAFSGVTWDELLKSYRTMVWVDFQAEGEHFSMVARSLGLLKT